VYPTVFDSTSTLTGNSDLSLRIVTVPEFYEEAWRHGVEMEKNRKKSSNCDSYVTCVDVHCFLQIVLKLNGCSRCAICISRGLIWQRVSYLKTSVLLVQIVFLWSLSIVVWIIFTSNELLVKIRNLKSNASQNDWKDIFASKNALQARFLIKQNAPQARLIIRCMPLFWLNPDG